MQECPKVFFFTKIESLLLKVMCTNQVIGWNELSLLLFLLLRRQTIMEQSPGRHLHFGPSSGLLDCHSTTVVVGIGVNSVSVSVLLPLSGSLLD